MLKEFFNQQLIFLKEEREASSERLNLVLEQQMPFLMILVGLLSNKAQLCINIGTNQNCLRHFFLLV